MKTAITRRLLKRRRKKQTKKKDDKKKNDKKKDEDDEKEKGKKRRIESIDDYRMPIRDHRKKSKVERAQQATNSAENERSEKS